MSATLSCWVTRMEVDPRFNYGEDTFDPPAGAWAPDCGHPICLADEQASATGGGPACLGGGGMHDWDCAVATCRFDTAHAMCALDEGHGGEHVYVFENQIILYFPDAGAARQEGDG